MSDIDGFGAQDVADQFPVSRETLHRLEAFIAGLDKWRQRINLIGPKEFERVWRRHVLDSMQLVAHVPTRGPILDMGAGGGFPGLVLACHREPGAAPIHLVESVGKKCAFLKQISRDLGLATQVHNIRIEAAELDPIDCVTARAFAPLPALLEYGAPWFSRGAHGVFLKGQNWQEELTLAEKYWRFHVEVIPSVSDSDGVILKLSEISRVGL